MLAAYEERKMGIRECEWKRHRMDLLRLRVLDGTHEAGELVSHDFDNDTGGGGIEIDMGRADLSDPQNSSRDASLPSRTR